MIRFCIVLLVALIVNTTARRLLADEALRSDKTVSDALVTFNDQIATIIHSHCSGCHRPGQTGPFDLIDYAQVRKHARTIQGVVNERYMPPWQPVEGHGDFAGVRRLSTEQIGLLNRWVEDGCPEGDAASAPTRPNFPSDWWLGKPDMVVAMKDTFVVPAEGPDIYRSFVVPLDLPNDKWVKAVELRPQSRSVLHHALFFLDRSGAARRQDGADGRPGFQGMRFQISGRLGAYVPGTTPSRLPGDLAMALPRGSDLVMQTHFHPTGKQEKERSQLALYFTDKKPSKELVDIQLPPHFGRTARIDIPPGEKRYELNDHFELPVDVDAVVVGGHAHYICEEMKMVAILPDGTTRPLFYIDDWNLDWQDRYHYRSSVRLPAGTTLHSYLRYDNSRDNPDNPNDPVKRIRWGLQSTDEMGSITLTVTATNNEDAAVLKRAVQRHRFTGSAPVAKKGTTTDVAENRRSARAVPSSQNPADIMKRLDTNRDGKLQKSEVPLRYRGRLFDRLDRNSDRYVDAEELNALTDILSSSKPGRAS